MATSLFNAGLISQELHARVTSGKTRRESGEKLQLAVTQIVESIPEKFAVFVSVLNEDLSLYEELLTLMNQTYKSTYMQHTKVKLIELLSPLFLAITWAYMHSPFLAQIVMRVNSSSNYYRR